MKVFSNPAYRPVFKCVPAQEEWRRVDSETLFEATYTVYFKFSWLFDVPFNQCEVYFAYAPAYSYADVKMSICRFIERCPEDSFVFKEVLCKSIDGNEVELLTFSQKNNFYETCELEFQDILNGSRTKAAKKQIIFISARVHPGETPSSYLLESFLLFITSSDPRAIAMRNNYVFKIIPVLNPDGVIRGNFRVDQNGINLNRCYENPDESLQPTIFAVKLYFEYLSSNIKYYFDFHAHASKKSCFLFGNFMEIEKMIENHLFAKLLEINSSFFEFNDCNFSEKSMNAKDPKDHHSKSGSGRVNFYKSFGILHSYTIESSFFIPRALHLTPSPLYIKSVKRMPEVPQYETYTVQVFNRNMYNELSSGICSAILDLDKLNPCSRLPLSEFRFLESAREWVRSRILLKTRFSKRPARSAQKYSSGQRPRKSQKTEFCLPIGKQTFFGPIIKKNLPALKSSGPKAMNY
jgi:hypothetical protein